MRTLLGDRDQLQIVKAKSHISQNLRFVEIIEFGRLSKTVEREGDWRLRVSKLGISTFN